MKSQSKQVVWRCDIYNIFIAVIIFQITMSGCSRGVELISKPNYFPINDAKASVDNFLKSELKNQDYAYRRHLIQHDGRYAFAYHYGDGLIPGDIFFVLVCNNTGEILFCSTPEFDGYQSPRYRKEIWGNILKKYPGAGGER